MAASPASSCFFLSGNFLNAAGGVDLGVEEDLVLDLVADTGKDILVEQGVAVEQLFKFVHFVDRGTGLVSCLSYKMNIKAAFSYFYFFALVVYCIEPESTRDNLFNFVKR